MKVNRLLVIPNHRYENFWVHDKCEWPLVLPITIINNKDKGFIFVIPADEYNAAMTIYFLEKKEVYN